MRWLALLVPLVLFLAFIVGWAFPGRPETPLGVTRGQGQAASLTLRPGESTGTAVRFLRTLRSDPPPPAPVVIAAPPLPPPPPPPPPPDVAVVFKAGLSAIERDPNSGRYQALVRDPAAMGTQIRAMNVGDRYGAGWRITDISADRVTLGRGRDVRVILLFG